jgi:phage FluMu protein Com
MKREKKSGRNRKKRRTWRQLLVEEILRLGDTDNPLPLDEQNAPEMLARIERFADMGWFEAFPGGRLEKRSDLSALEQLRGLVTEARTFLRSFQNDESYDPEPIIVTVEQRADKAARGWTRVRYIRLEDDPLKVKVRTALVEAFNQKREMRGLRCGMCKKLFVAIRKDQNYCTTKCSKKAVDKEKVKSGRAAEYMARSRYAKVQGVPIDQVRARKDGGKWKFRLEKAKAPQQSEVKREK